MEESNTNILTSNMTVKHVIFHSALQFLHTQFKHLRYIKGSVSFEKKNAFSKKSRFSLFNLDKLHLFMFLSHLKRTFVQSRMVTFILYYV